MNQGPSFLFLQAAKVPSDLDWLSPAERDYLAGLRVAHRRADWLLGRWTAKQTLVKALDVAPPDRDLTRFEVLPRSTGAPAVLVDGAESAVAISLSHRGGAGLCVCARAGSVGCDLERIEERSSAFIEDYFTTAERVWIPQKGAESRALMANLLWSAKESVLKLLGLGLSVDTRSLTVRSMAVTPSEEWQSFMVAYHPDSKSFTGWWRRQDDWVLTIATEPPSGSPVELERPLFRWGKVPAS